MRPRLALPLVLVATSLAGAPAATAQGLGLPNGVFDVTAPSDHYRGGLLGAKLKGPNALQSFAFDEQAKHLYVLQTVENAKAGGDLWLNRLDYDGKLLDHMRLNGFGHGVSMGVSRDDGKVSIWVESASKPNSGGDGFGTRVARVIYTPGRSVSSPSVLVKDVTPPGTAGKSPRPVIDPVTGDLVVRYSASGAYGFVAVPRADALAGRFSATRRLGSTPSAGEKNRPGGKRATSQGYTVAGTRAYLYYGDSYDHVKKPGNAYIRQVTLNPSKRATGRIGYSYSLKDLPFREPEGITVQVNGGAPRLVFGFASDPKGGGTKRSANFSYKQAWKPDAAPAPTPVTPPPAATPVPQPATPVPVTSGLVVHPRKVTRSGLKRTRRVTISVAGADGIARVRVSAMLGGRRVTLYSAPRRVAVARSEVVLRLSAASVRRIRRAGGRVTLTVTVKLGETVERVRARVR